MTSMKITIAHLWVDSSHVRIPLFNHDARLTTLNSKVILITNSEMEQIAKFQRKLLQN